MTDLAIGLAAGYLATEVMDRLQWRHRQAKQSSRPSDTPGDKEGSARSLVQRLGARIHRQPDGHELSRLGHIVHRGFGMGWGVLYGTLRRTGGMAPLGAGFCIGSSLSLVIDGVVHPALGVAPPVRASSPADHARRLAGRLVYGMTIAAFAEGLQRLRRLNPLAR